VKVLAERQANLKKKTLKVSLASRSRTVVENLTHNAKIKGSNTLLAEGQRKSGLKMTNLKVT
jgi:hypothetical protein